LSKEVYNNEVKKDGKRNSEFSSTHCFVRINLFIDDYTEYVMQYIIKQ